MWAKINLTLSLSSLHLSLHVRTALRPSLTAGRHSFTSDGLIMVPPLRSLDQTWSAHCRSLSFFLSHIHTHNHIHEMHPFIQDDAIRGGSQGKLIKLKAGPAVCRWAAETQTSQHLLITCLYYLQHCLHIVRFCLSRDYCLSFMHNWLGVED